MKQKEKIAALRAKIDELNAELETEFKTGLEALLQAHTEVESIVMSVNNHEFNDGDRTYFSLHSDDLAVCFAGQIPDDDGYSETEIPEHLKGIRGKFIEYFAEYDDDDFFERIFGEAYETISIGLKDGKFDWDS